MEQQEDEEIYFMGWNKRIELRKNGNFLIYSKGNQYNSIIRLTCNLVEKTMIMEKNNKRIEEINYYIIIKEAVVDLSDEGERWEGDLLNGFPFGYGYLYNAENELVYSGFMYQGEKMCFGEEFQNSVLQYSGHFYKNQRHGYGKLYDVQSKVVYEGDWCFGKSDTNVPSLSCGLNDEEIHHLVKKLIINDNYSCCTELQELKIVDYPALETISIGNGCFSTICFEISNCMKLEKLLIGKESFYKRFLLAETKFLIHDCTRLKEISIGSYSFLLYEDAFELKSMN